MKILIIFSLIKTWRRVVVPTGWKQRVAIRFLLLAEAQQLLNGERRSVLVELGGRLLCRCRRSGRSSLLRWCVQSKGPIQIVRAEERPATEAKRSRSGIGHCGFERGNVMRQTWHVYLTAGFSKTDRTSTSDASCYGTRSLSATPISPTISPITLI